MDIGEVVDIVDDSLSVLVGQHLFWRDDHQTSSSFEPRHVPCRTLSLQSAFCRNCVGRFLCRLAGYQRNMSSDVSFLLVPVRGDHFPAEVHGTRDLANEH